MSNVLTGSQREALQVALTLYEANGASTRTIKGRVYETLALRGWFQSVLGKSTRGGNASRWYLFTEEGLRVARQVKFEADTHKAWSDPDWLAADYENEMAPWSFGRET